MTDAAPTHADLKSTLEEMRASAAEAETLKGLAGMVQDAFLRILGLLLAMLIDFRAGRFAAADLAAPDAPAEGGGDAPCAAPREPAAPAREPGRWGFWQLSWFRRDDRIPAFAGTAAGSAQSAPPSGGSAPSDCGSACRNDAKTGRDPSRRIERPSARQPEDAGADTPHEDKSAPPNPSPAPRNRAWMPRAAAIATPSHPAGTACAVREPFFQKGGRARENWRGRIVPA